ncbi:hypothetical protein ACCO45_005672 [Purpureocillium lilacinum]|uniref:Uncharacterized protein n=1 Tax=Purpureocillium lilacinum TaxID=33203 RepID=A0ACC4DW41_PURLI
MHPSLHCRWSPGGWGYVPGSCHRATRAEPRALGLNWRPGTPAQHPGSAPANDPPIPHQSAVASTYQSVHSALSSSRPFDDTQAIASSTRRSSTAAQPRRPRSTQRRPEESLAARSPTRATATRADRGAVVAAVACAYP